MICRRVSYSTIGFNRPKTTICYVWGICSDQRRGYKGSEYGELVAERCKCKDCQPYPDKLARYSWRKNSREYNKEADFEELYFRSWETSHIGSDVGDSVALTIWIHNGRTDILFGREAADKFNEYNDIYCAPEYVERGFLSPFNENAIVVTKEWVIRQYNTIS